jgi:MFS family permease
MEPKARAGLAVFRHRNFALYQVQRFLMVAALEMQSVAVGWQVYEITRRALDLGFVGLAQFLPNVFLFLVAGHAADRYSRKQLLFLCNAGFALCSLLLIAITRSQSGTVRPIYAVLVLLGVVRAFNSPAGRSLLPALVPMSVFPQAVAWNSTIYQAGSILGPALGGLLYAVFRGPAGVYAASIGVSAIAILALLRIRLQPSFDTAAPRELDMRSMLAGLDYIWTHKIILGSISLDLFAVLLGGAPWGLGLLRAAPGAGAALMATFLAYRTLERRVGKTMLLAVASFGAATIVFGISRHLVVSLIALVLAGAMDMISVVIRGTLVQIRTPDSVRGRVNAVDMIFIGASNELGQFESGLTAHWFGTVPAVILGGMGTLVIVVLWAWLFPELRKANQLSPIEQIMV